MATIKHPDTYRCDLCGMEYPNRDHITRIEAPFRINEVATEYGNELSERLWLDSREFDLCDPCLWKVVVIEEVPKFYEESEYKLFGRGLLPDADE